MNIATSAFSLLALLLAPAISHAIPLPNLDDLSLRTGYVANFGSHERLRYDADADQLTYSVGGSFDYGNHLCGSPGRPCVDPPIAIEFDGLLAWTAGVDEYGLVKNPGSMIWMGDFGNGLEALASGRLVGVGTGGVGTQLYDVDEALFFTVYSNMQFLFDIDFLDQRVAGMGDRMLLLFEQEFHTLDESIFARDFDCGSGMETPTFPKCVKWSTSGLVGRKVPEPSPLALLLVAVGIVQVFRRRSLPPSAVRS